jgi:DNA invertase Pin-like site-specific DNA recombinase
MQIQDHMIALPTDDKAAVYARTAQVLSKSGQELLDRLHSRNTDVLFAVARQYGFPPENLITFEDSGVSGMTRIDEREGLGAFVNAIERDEIKTVFLLSEHRLSRDAAIIAVNYFIELCKRHHVFVVTLTQIYDFTNPLHVQLFRFQLETAQFAIYTRTTIARRYKALRMAAAPLEEKE